MFLAGDDASIREDRIWRYFGSNPGVALILAAINFEWTVCRAVLFLSPNPNGELRELMVSYYSLDGYKDLWTAQVSNSRHWPRLVEVVRNWPSVRDGFHARNLLVHGRDRYTSNMARAHVDALLKGAAYVESYCLSRDFPLASRMPIRRKQGFSKPRPNWVHPRERVLKEL